MGDDPHTIIVVPCFDEAERLDTKRFEEFARANPSVSFLFVDDGSRDRTRSILEATAARSPGITVLALERNSGKAEAVRRGMQKAFESQPAFIGYFDADLATPLDEIHPMRRMLLGEPLLRAVLGSRVALLGRSIRRTHRRHYLGRVFATAASIVLDLVVYDTQCGAKLFRNDEAIRRAFAEPFQSRWVFDVELLARLKTRDVGGNPPDLTRSVAEYPLQSWCDVAGTKLSAHEALGAGFELARIWKRYRHSW